MPITSWSTLSAVSRSIFGAASMSAKVGWIFGTSEAAATLRSTPSTQHVSPDTTDVAPTQL
eukprot:6099146-Prymnesium_polylepis.1